MAERIPFTAGCKPGATLQNPVGQEWLTWGSVNISLAMERLSQPLGRLLIASTRGGLTCEPG